ncbi:MAG: phosphoribosylamine--glycine ligase [Bacteroidetes bacterium]|nr:phosphoribosylamine--glycine ligase [Bacteroidota bacterium]
MNILILGSGGREHVFAWKMSQSPLCDQLFIAPGNAGTASCGNNIPISPNDCDAVKSVVLDKKIDMVVVGPEDPLVLGIYDYLKSDEATKHLGIIGPSKEGAKLEGSKSYAKVFMEEQGIPTAAYGEFTQITIDDGIEYIKRQTPPIVLKADGLAAGKGVLICKSAEEAVEEFKEMLAGKFGAAGDKVVVEAFLDGIEFSVFVLTDGENYKTLPIAKDYKRVGEGDTGLNTGGMGSISPVSFVDDVLMEKVKKQIIEPTMEGIQKRNIIYPGFIFLGLIKVGDDPYVIEYNCRMGDPETQVVLPRLKNDLVHIFKALTEGNLENISIEMEERTAAAIILASGGYPQSYEKGKVITGLDNTENCIVFHAGTKSENKEIVTNGGRVIAITSYGKNMDEALLSSNKNAAIIDFEKKYFRSDIGFDL